MADEKPKWTVKPATPTPEAGTPKVLSFADIAAAEDIVTVDVDVPEWGGIVKLRGLSGKEAMEFAEIGKAEGGSVNAASLVALAAVNADGSKLFTREQVEVLKGKSMKAIMRLQRVALEMNGLGAAGAADTKAN